MTHEETSLQTKKMLCASLKEIMKHKAFSKITVSELIKDCNLNRKTFYYHFEDIYGLLKWMLEQEAFEVVKQFDLLVDYKDAFDFVIHYVRENSFFLNCIYDSVGRDQLKRFFYQDFIGVLEKIVKDVSNQLGVLLDTSFECFLCNFYTEALAGMLIDLFQKPDEYDPDLLFNHFEVLLHTSLPAVILSQKKEA